MKRSIRFFITSLGSGGAERVLVNLLAWLDPEKYKVSLMTVYGGTNEKNLPPYVEYKRIIKGSGKLSKLIKKILLKLPPRLFASLFLKGVFDFEVAYLEGVPTAFLLAKRTSGRKIAFVHCDLSVNKTGYPLYSNAEKCLKAYSRFDRVCFVSEDARRGFESAIGHLDNAAVVHNVIDVKSILSLAEQPADREYDDASLKLITVGRLAPEKNFSMLLSVVSELSIEYSIELWIVGDGELRGELSEIKESKNLDNVHFLGYSDNPYPYIKKADMFVCSSLFEGYSTAVLESVVLSTPVITTDCAGMSEILGDGRFGMIVENSKEGLKKGIIKIINDPEILNKYRSELKKFSPDELPFNKDYNELFDY